MLETSLMGSPVGGGVELEVDRPHPVRCVGARSVRGGACAGAFASSALRHPQPLLAPEPLDLLVVDRPALATGIGVGIAEHAPRMILGPVPQPRPQRSVR